MAGGWLGISLQEFDFSSALVRELAGEIIALQYRGVTVKYSIEDRSNKSFGSVTVDRMLPTKQVLVVELTPSHVVIRSGQWRKSLIEESYDLVNPQSLDRVFEILKERFG